MNCGYCVIFNTSTIRTNSDRYCTVTHRQVAREEKRCDRFEPYHIVWCIKNHYQIDMAACSARQDRGVEECSKCHQGQRVRHFERLQKIKGKNLESPTITIKRDRRRKDTICSQV